MVERDLEEVNGCFDCHQGEINCLKIMEKEVKEKVEELEGFIIGAGHDTKIFKDVRKLDLSHLCFSLNFYFLMFLLQFPSMFPLLTYSQSFFSLSADYPRHSRRRRSKIRFY